MAASAAARLRGATLAAAPAAMPACAPRARRGGRTPTGVLPQRPCLRSAPRSQCGSAAVRGASRWRPPDRRLPGAVGPAQPQWCPRRRPPTTQVKRVRRRTLHSDNPRLHSSRVQSPKPRRFPWLCSLQPRELQRRALRPQRTQQKSPLMGPPPRSFLSAMTRRRPRRPSRALRPQRTQRQTPWMRPPPGLFVSTMTRKRPRSPHPTA
mmetsp:Transcript_72898/g.225202  ORF Transcript_72898/g.225202 Transcript_72898/m.225202 type:complete len:208 (+) Transcript_72898:79-702(+)